jgi:hypothetical protein
MAGLNVIECFDYFWIAKPRSSRPLIVLGKRRRFPGENLNYPFAQAQKVVMKVWNSHYIQRCNGARSDRDRLGRTDSLEVQKKCHR